MISFPIFWNRCGATEESCETCSVRLDSAWSPRVILAVAATRIKASARKAISVDGANPGTGSFTQW